MGTCAGAARMMDRTAPTRSMLPDTQPYRGESPARHRVILEVVRGCDGPPAEHSSDGPGAMLRK